ncbi:hypothetical protein CFR76_12530 [Komagataeibacter swingsii]|uniref:Uncharacterized protein n=1 Tax=Komagataeibacter swingsii TaxID=215220 RepID=A0A2V4RJP0_9PROT|nr:hypothetical protein CFR76_12530 [Komagataeibacter swingsii]
MLECLAAPGWLACGNEAIAFDPLCGDGTAQAAREAILAAAVITAIMEYPDDPHAMETLLMHYRSMLLASMRRHLRFCAQFYSMGGNSPWWRTQISALATGFEWCSGQLAGLPQPRYELHGLRLVPRMVPA